MEGKKYEILEQKMCKELEMLEQKYDGSPTEMTVQDLEKIDKLFHALKSMATYHAMKEAEEYEEMNGMSGRRGRAANGRYVSQDTEPRMSGYHDGYSGHHPVYPSPDYGYDRGYPRW